MAARPAVAAASATDAQHQQERGQRGHDQENHDPTTNEASSSKSVTEDEPDLVSQSANILRRFLAFVSPDDLAHVEQSQQAAAEVPISQWTTIYASKGTDESEADTAAQKQRQTRVQSSVLVRRHPSADQHLFSIQSVLPGVTARQFWTLMAESRNRHLWDTTVEDVTIQRWLGSNASAPTPEASLAGKISARIETLRFGSIMFVASKRDMILLSVDTQLPSTEKGKLRLLSTSSSIDDANAFPTKKGYTRFQLQIGGFLVEDVGDFDSNGLTTPENYGVRITQLADLGVAATWVPSTVIKMVASSLVPRSLNVIGKVAIKIEVPDVLSVNSSTDLDAQTDSATHQDTAEESILDSKSRAIWYAWRGLPSILSKEDWRAASPASGTPCDVMPPSSVKEAESAQTGSELHSLSFQPLSTKLTRSLSTATTATSTSSHHSPNIALSLTDPGSMSMSASFSHSIPASRFTMSLPSGTETAPGSPALSMSNDPSRQLGAAAANLAAHAEEQEEEGDKTLVRTSSLSQESSRDEYMNEESLQTSVSFSTEDENELCALLSEALHDDDVLTPQQQTDRRTQAWIRMNQLQQRQRDAVQKRLSILLLQGSDAVAMALAPAARDSMTSVATCFLGHGGGASGSELRDVEERAEDEDEDLDRTEDVDDRRLGSGYLVSLDDSRQGCTTFGSNSRIAVVTTTPTLVNGHLTSTSDPFAGTPKSPTTSEITLADNGVEDGPGAANEDKKDEQHWSNGIISAPISLAAGLWGLTLWATMGGQSDGGNEAEKMKAILAAQSTYVPSRITSDSVRPTAALLAARQMYMLGGGSKREDDERRRRRNGSSPSKDDSLSSLSPSSSSSQFSKHSRSPAGSSRRMANYRINDAKLHPFPALAAQYFEQNGVREPLPPLGMVGGRANSMECAPASALFHEGSQRQRIIRLSTGGGVQGSTLKAARGSTSAVGEATMDDQENIVLPSGASSWWNWTST